MKLEGALWISYLMHERKSARAFTMLDGFLFCIERDCGSATEEEELPNGTITMKLFVNALTPQERLAGHEYRQGTHILTRTYQVEKIVLVETIPTHKDPLFDCIRELERIFGLDDEFWKPQ